MTNFPHIERGTYLIVRTDGTEELVPEKPTTEKICKTIGAETLDDEPITFTQGRPLAPDLATFKATLARIAGGAGFDHTIMMGGDFELERARKGLIPDLIMLVDGNGYEKQTVDHGNGRIELVPRRARLPVNQRASELYWSVCKPEYRGAHQIVGDVVLAHDQDFAK